MFSIGSMATMSLLFAQLPEATRNNSPGLLTHVLAVVVYSIVGVVVLAACFWIMKRMMPFSVTKEIEQDQNIALAILMGSVIIGMSIIIAAAVL